MEAGGTSPPAWGDSLSVIPGGSPDGAPEPVKAFKSWLDGSRVRASPKGPDPEVEDELLLTELSDREGERARPRDAEGTLLLTELLPEWWLLVLLRDLDSAWAVVAPDVPVGNIGCCHMKGLKNGGGPANGGLIPPNKPKSAPITPGGCGRRDEVERVERVDRAELATHSLVRSDVLDLGLDRRDDRLSRRQFRLEPGDEGSSLRSESAPDGDGERERTGPVETGTPVDAVPEGGWGVKPWPANGGTQP